MSCKKKSGSWNDMDELKYLICAIDCRYVQFNLGNPNDPNYRVFHVIEEKCLIVSP